MPKLQVAPNTNTTRKSTAQNSTARNTKATKPKMQKPTPEKSKEKGKEPEPVTVKALQNRMFTCKWDETINMLDEFPHLARSADDCGDLPLHVALWFHAPDSVILKLIHTYQEGIKIANNRQSFPLHIAASSGSSSLVVEKLILSYPEALDRRDNMGNTPRDYVKNKPDEMNKSMIMMPTLFWIKRKQHDDVKEATIQAQMKKITELEAKLKEPKTTTTHALDTTSQEIIQRLGDIDNVLKSLINDVVSKSNFLFSEIDALRAFSASSTGKRKQDSREAPNEYIAVGGGSSQENESSMNAKQNNDQKSIVVEINQLIHYNQQEEKYKRQKKVCYDPDTTTSN